MRLSNPTIVSTHRLKNTDLWQLVGYIMIYVVLVKVFFFNLSGDIKLLTESLAKHYIPASRLVTFYLVSTVNLLGLLVVPLWMPGPCTLTLVGSQPSITGTRKGLLGTGLPS